MIKLNEKARLECETCEEYIRVPLILLNNGGFGIDASAVGGWDVGFDKDKVAPYRGLCPACKERRPRVTSALIQ